MKNIRLVWTLFLIDVCVIVAILRFVIPMPGLDLSAASVYKDAAHLFVGGLFGAAVASSLGRLKAGRALWLMAVALTIVEVVAFFAGKH